MLAAVVILGPATSRASAQDLSAEGQRQFRARCGGCHAVEAGKTGIGPNLAGVLGRRAGSASGARYSQALANATITWDAATLDQFLTNPKALVPGTLMAISVKDANIRAALISYLATVH
ncbi:c-type cytochrome [Agrobacterium leguminum]|uniref:c-type cytochrome n=1 Tax=Agrobacterium leguminum TaxID=2792015 RepID=UPI001F42AD3E|nr:c-type cytochrome [Agrobacterium leguminum]